MQETHTVNTADMHQFSRLNEDGQAHIVDAFQRTRAMINDYCKGSDPAYGKVLRQLLTLSTKTLEKHGLNATARRFQRHYNELYCDLTAGILSADDIVGRFEGVKEDIEDSLKALRKKSGDESPLGDSVNLSHIGVAVAENVTAAEQPINERTGQWQRQREQASHAYRRDVEAPAYVTRPFFEALTEYLATLKPEVLKGLSEYCNGQGRYSQVDAQVRVDLGSALTTSPILKTAIIASIDEKRAVVSTPETAQHRFNQLLQTLTPKLMQQNNYNVDHGPIM